MYVALIFRRVGCLARQSNLLEKDFSHLLDSPTKGPWDMAGEVTHLQLDRMPDCAMCPLIVDEFN